MNTAVGAFKLEPIVNLTLLENSSSAECSNEIQLQRTLLEWIAMGPNIFFSNAKCPYH